MSPMPSSPIPAATDGNEALDDNTVLAFRTLGSRAQGRIVRLGSVADDILSGHDFPEAVSRILGEAVALSAMLGSLLHANGRLILQTKTDGPVRMLVVDYTSPPKSDTAPEALAAGRIRATAAFDPERVAAAIENERLASQATLLGAGHFAMTIDTGSHEPRTQGIVGLDHQSLTDAALTYFAQSEQIPTFVRLAVARHQVRAAPRSDPGADPVWRWRAGGLILQQLPDDVGTGVVRGEDADDDHVLGERDEDWQRARILAATVEDHELLDPTLTPDRLLYRLFHEEGVRISEPVLMQAYCGCNRERVELLLKGFGPAELADMREPDGGVTVTCEYCSKTYRFTPADIDGM